MLHLILLMILFETYVGFKLDCTNDYEQLIFCHIDARNCTEVKLTLKEAKSNKISTCSFEPCVRGCCCETNAMANLIIYGNTFNAVVYKNGQSVHSQPFRVYETIKPQTPTISMDKFNDMYHIIWRTNTRRSIREDLCAIVTYQKKGDTPMISACLTPSIKEDINDFQILGRNLEPSTTYVVRVKTYTRFNVSSDSSEEVEFTTDSSRSGVFIAVILSLCAVAIVISGVLFASFIKLKRMLWDKAAKVERPKLLDITPKKKMILTPESPSSVYSLSVEPLIPKDLISKESQFNSGGRSGQSSGMSSASSSLGYANTVPVDSEACDANTIPVDSEACVLGALKDTFPMFTPCTETSRSGEPKQNCVTVPSAFDNAIYIMGQFSKMTHDTEGQVTSDSGYHSSDTPPIQDFIIPPHGLISETDISYQPCFQSEDASNATDSHSFLSTGYGYQGFEKQSTNVLTELRNILQSTEVSDEIIVDSGYHSV